MARKPSQVKRNTTKVRIRNGQNAHAYFVAQALRNSADDGKADYTRLDTTEGSVANLFSDTGIKLSSWLALRPKLEQLGLFYDDAAIETFNPKDVATARSGEGASKAEYSDSVEPFEQHNSLLNVADKSTIEADTAPDISLTTPQDNQAGLDAGTSMGSMFNVSSPIEAESQLTIPKNKWSASARLFLSVSLICAVFVLVSRPWETRSEPSNAPSKQLVPERSTEQVIGLLKEDISEAKKHAIVTKPTDMPFSWAATDHDFELDLDVRVAHGDHIQSLDDFEGPLESGDSIKIRLFSKHPLYHQLFWLDPSGGVDRLYPDHDSKVSSSTTIELPIARDDFFVVKSEAEGLHALVAIASQQPLTQNPKLEPLPQPASKVLFEQGAIFFDQQGVVNNPNRSSPVTNARVTTKNDPIGVLSTLTKSSANQQVDAVRAVCFVVERN